MKENIDINHIKQSGYKISRSKSHRKGHSLERKVPIVSTCQHTEAEGTKESALKEISLNTGPREFTVRIEPT
jgi:hypothetical protein